MFSEALKCCPKPRALAVLQVWEEQGRGCRCVGFHDGEQAGASSFVGKPLISVSRRLLSLELISFYRKEAFWPRGL